MKKIIKWILLGGGLLFLLKNNVFASNQFELEEDQSGLTYMIYAGHTEYPFHFKFIKDKETKELVYCLEPGVVLSNEEYEELSEWEYQKLNWSPEQKEYLTKVAYYGYGYKDHTSLNYYYAAQMLIWENVMPAGWEMYYTQYFSGPKAEWFSEEREEILRLVEESKKLPSISLANTSWNGIDKLILTDENYAIQNYQLITDTTNHVEIKENRIEITGMEEITLEFVQIYEGEPLKFYIRQDGQDLMRKGSLEPSRLKIKVSPYHLDVKIQKVNEQNQPLKDVEFSIYAKEDIKNSQGNIVHHEKEEIARLKTDVKGQISLKNLWDGTYCIQEISAPYQYKVNPTPVCFQLSKEEKEKTITIKNELEKRKLIIIKEDEETKEALQNVRFQIWNEQNQLIFDGKTDQEGIITLDDLPLGKYKIMEIETVEGYEFEKEPIYIDIRKEQDKYTITITNRKIKEVPKTGTEKKPIYWYQEKRKKRKK